MNALIYIFQKGQKVEISHVSFRLWINIIVVYDLDSYYLDTEVMEVLIPATI